MKRRRAFEGMTFPMFAMRVVLYFSVPLATGIYAFIVTTLSSIALASFSMLLYLEWCVKNVISHEHYFSKEKPENDSVTEYEDRIDAKEFSDNVVITFFPDDKSEAERHIATAQAGKYAGEFVIEFGLAYLYEYIEDGVQDKYYCGSGESFCNEENEADIGDIASFLYGYVTDAKIKGYW